MARNKTLLKLLDDFRAECRLSLNPAHNAQQRETQVKHLQRVQEYLYDDFDWPHLRCERLFAPQTGQRYYVLPDDVQLERIQHLEIRWANIWRPLLAGIEPGHYAQFDSDAGVTYDPAVRWRIWEDDQIELWPVPATAGDPTTQDLMIKVVGIRRLAPLVDDEDRCDLDDRLIVLYAAAEYLASTGATDAKLKLDQANKRYGSIKADLTPRRRVTLFGSEPARTVLRGMPPIQYRTTEVPAPAPAPDPITVVVRGGREG